jgi:type IV pilus assembly protein PilC
MVTAGESSGMLDSILERLSVHMEKSIKLKREVKTAMIYPSIVMSVAVIVTAVLLVFVIPTFKDLYDSSSMQLPGLTQFVINISDFMARSWYWIFGTIALGLIVLCKGLKTRRGQELLHPLILKLPVLGGIVKKVCVARFTRTLGTMISSGVPILDALTVCSRTAGNKVIEQEVGRARLAISEGQPLAEPLQTSTVFSPMVVQMISVGESTGALDAMLIKVAEFFEQEVDSAVAALKQSIEPIMIVVIGLIVGVLVVAMYLPIFEMGRVVGI